MIDWLRQRILMAATSAALTLVGVRFFTPGFVDVIIDFLTVGLVYVATLMAKK